MMECNWNSGLCAFVFESVDVTCCWVPSVHGLLTDSAAELSSVPDFAQRRPPDLPVWERIKTQAAITIFSKSLSKQHFSYFLYYLSMTEHHADVDKVQGDSLETDTYTGRLNRFSLTRYPSYTRC